MKTSLLAVLALVPCLALADSGSTSTSPTATTLNPAPPDPAQELAAMTEKLKLSPAQQDAIRPILVAEAAQKKAIQDNTTLSDKEKQEQSFAVHRMSLQQIKALFTPEQMALIEDGMKHPSASPTHPETSTVQTDTSM